MSKQPLDKLHGVVPHDGTYLGARKGKQLKQAEIKAKFDESWELQAKLLKNSSVLMLLVGKITRNGYQLISDQRPKKQISLKPLQNGSNYMNGTIGKQGIIAIRQRKATGINVIGIKVSYVILNT
jgi:hypothetical protein